MRMQYFWLLSAWDEYGNKWVLHCGVRMGLGLGRVLHDWPRTCWSRDCAASAPLCKHFQVACGCVKANRHKIQHLRTRWFSQWTWESLVGWSLSFFTPPLPRDPFQEVLMLPSIIADRGQDAIVKISFCHPKLNDATLIDLMIVPGHKTKKRKPSRMIDCNRCEISKRG